jgi:archaellum component FlaF (FlaF/FlaG flagellin family)
VTLNTEKLRDYGLTQTTVYIGRQLGEKVSEDNSMGVSVVLLPDMKEFEAANKAIAPKLQISATDIDFTNFEGKSKKTAEVILQNNGQSLLRISSMQLFTRGLKVTLDNREIQPGQSAKIKITGVASELQKVRTRPRILMITNDPDHAKVVINIKK